MALTLAPGLPHPEPHAEHLLRDAIHAVNADMAVLLLGETGAGKEIFARHVHSGSCWRTGPFVAVNCGALPESLIESELFGYAPGAFTGARREGSPGLLRQAEGGILFLDEIGDMPLGLQTRLLRALQEREVQPLGSNKRIPVRFGVVSATHRALDAMMAAGTFRPDL
jgi:transcriptional regulator with PAS, ATPase and Fis domain